MLSSVATTTGGVCLVLTDFPVQCIPTFTAGQHVAWIVTPSGTGTTLIWGIERDDVESVEAVSDDDTTTHAELGNNGFYIEVEGDQPARLVVQLNDGSFDVVPLFPCPLTAPVARSRTHETPEHEGSNMRYHVQVGTTSILHRDLNELAESLQTAIRRSRASC